MDSVPPIRRKAYEHLKSLKDARCNDHSIDEFVETSAVAKAVRLPTTTVRRALEDLAAYKVVERASQGQGKPDIWKIQE